MCRHIFSLFFAPTFVAFAVMFVRSAWALSNGCKSLTSPNSGNCIANSKGVHCEVESERSWRQTFERGIWQQNHGSECDKHDSECDKRGSEKKRKNVSAHSRQETWGTSVIDRISKQLRRELPGLHGFFSQNIRNMRSFYEYWRQYIICSPMARKLQKCCGIKVPYFWISNLGK